MLRPLRRIDVVKIASCVDRLAVPADAQKVARAWLLILADSENRLLFDYRAANTEQSSWLLLDTAAGITFRCDTHSAGCLFAMVGAVRPCASQRAQPTIVHSAVLSAMAR